METLIETEVEAPEVAPIEVPDHLVLPSTPLLEDEKVDELAETWRLPAYWLLHVDGELVRETGNGGLRLPYEVGPQELVRRLPSDGQAHRVQVELRATSIAAGRPGLRVLTVDVGEVMGPPPAAMAVVGPTGLEAASAPLGAGGQTHYWQPHTVPPPDAFMALVGFARDTQRAAFEAVGAQHVAYRDLAAAEREHNRDMFTMMMKQWNTVAIRQTETVDHLAERLTEALAGLRPGQPRDEPAGPAEDNPLMELAKHAPALIKQVSEFLPEEVRGELITAAIEKFTGGGGVKNELAGVFGDAIRAAVTKWSGVDIMTPVEEGIDG